MPTLRQDQFPLSDCSFLTTAPELDSQTERLGVKRDVNPSVTLTQAQVTRIDTCARHCLRALSHADTYTAAARSLLDPASERDQRLRQCLMGVCDSLAWVTNAACGISANALQWRRLSYLDLSTMWSSRRDELAGQPWTSGSLFNGQIGSAVVEQGQDLQRVALQSFLNPSGSIAQGRALEQSSNLAAAPRKAQQARSKPKASATASKRPVSDGPGGQQSRRPAVPSARPRGELLEEGKGWQATPPSF